MVKMPIYACHGVAYLWLVDPLERTLEAFALREGHWQVIGLHQEKTISHRSLPSRRCHCIWMGLWVESESE